MSEADGEKERPWWLDPRRLPPGTEAAMSRAFTPRRVQALRIVLALSLLAGCIAALMGHFLTGGILATSVLTQSLLWSSDQRKQVFGRS